MTPSSLRTTAGENRNPQPRGAWTVEPGRHIQVRGSHFSTEKKGGRASLAQSWEPTPSALLEARGKDGLGSGKTSGILGIMGLRGRWAGSCVSGCCSGLSLAGGPSSFPQLRWPLLAGASSFPRLTLNSLGMLAILAVVWQQGLATPQTQYRMISLIGTSPEG